MILMAPQPKDRKAITASKRVKITSADLKDLVKDIENYRKRMLDKNGFINLWPRNKPEVEWRLQRFNIFETKPPTRREDKYMKDSITPTQRREITLDNIGLHRAKRQYKSQPRHGVHHTNDNPVDINPTRPKGDIEFSQKFLSKTRKTE